MSYWTDNYFGSLYHEIYSRHILDPQRALEEAAFAAHVLDLGRRTVIDVACGFGRHARLLAQSNRVIAIDRSDEYARAAAADLPARAAGNLVAARADMRLIPLRDRSVDAAVMLFNSFGYFGADPLEIEKSAPAAAETRQVWKLPSVFYERQLVDAGFGKIKDPQVSDLEEKPAPVAPAEADPNGDVLHEIFRILKPGGGLLLELPNRRPLLEAVEENPRRLMVMDEYEIHEQFEWDGARNRLINRTRFVCGDREESAGYSVRLYEPAEIRALVADAGFKVKRVYGDYDGSRFGPVASDIMLIHAVRPSRKKA